MDELMKKRVSLTQAVIACAVTLLTAVGGSVAWATSFQTKSAAATVAARVTVVEAAQASASTEIHDTREDMAEVRAAVQRLDDKMDKVLMRMSVRR